MRPEAWRESTIVVRLLATAGVVLLVETTAAMASVDRIEVKSREPYHSSRVGPYVKITGSFIGSLDPGEPIPNLSRAPRRQDGRVEYKSGFVILAPESATAGNRVLLFDVENNGRPVTHALYNTPNEGSVAQLEFGNGFIEDNGFIVAIADWQNGRGITLPVYPGADGKPTPLTAVGFAAIRDFATFLRFEAQDRTGNANPLAGAIDHAIAAGSSQTGRFLKSFIHHGFNRIGTRTIFDGFHVHIGQSGSMPFIPPAGVSSDTIGLTITGDSSVYPFTYAEVLAPLRERGETPPKIIATNVEADYFRRRLSLVRTGANGYTEQPIPESVRMWDIAGGSHGIIPTQDCDMPRSNLDWHPILRAALVRLTSWVASNQAPPPTRQIVLGLPYLLPAPTRDYPAAKLMVPKRDDDGNSQGGIRLPLVAVPLQTWGAWNAPLENNCGDMAGFAYPFARTKFQRMMTGDSRVSLEERYRSRAEFMQKITEVANALVNDGYVLQADADVVIANARIASGAIPERATEKRH
jgi:hypothetical protein